MWHVSMDGSFIYYPYSDFHCFCLIFLVLQPNFLEQRFMEKCSNIKNWRSKMLFAFSFFNTEPIRC